MGFVEDLDVYLYDFGVSVVVGGETLTAIFDDEYADGLEVEGSNPRLVCKDADLPADLAHGTVVTYGTQTFVVRGIQPDGSGMTALELEETT